MNLRGKKVLLRAVEERDLNQLLEIINDEKTEKMLGGFSFPVSQKDQNFWYNNLKPMLNQLRCVIDVENNCIGMIILSDIDYKNGTAEIHIKLINSGIRRNGYGYDALKTIILYAFQELRLHCVYSYVLDYNVPSQNLFKKLGFKQDGILRERVYKNGKHNDLISFSIKNGELND